MALKRERSVEKVMPMETVEEEARREAAVKDEIRGGRR